MGDIGGLISTERRRRGWSQSRLAALLAGASGRPTVTRHDVSRWERGDRTPMFWLPWLARTLGKDIEELERAAVGELDRSASAALRVAQEWLVTDPPQRVHRRSGRRVGASMVEATRARVHELRLLDDHLGGADTVALVERELRVTDELVRDGSFRETVERHLLSVLGELAQLAGWVASDAGR